MRLPPDSQESLRPAGDTSGALVSRRSRVLGRATLLTEAGGQSGHGHLTRCVALADALRGIGIAPRLVVRGEAPETLTGQHEVLVSDWFEPASLDASIAGSDIVVLDSYHASVDLYEHLAERVSVCVWFDDTARLEYPKGIIVNGALHATELEYVHGDDVSLLLGSRYQVLRDAFWSMESRQVRPRIERALVVFGGTDVHSLTGRVSAALAAAHPEVLVDAVREPRTAQQMRDAMLAADVAVTAAGQTLHELATAGTPAIAVIVAENQVPQAKAFAAAGAIELVGRWDEPEVIDRVIAAVDKVAPHDVRSRMSARAQELLDGRGALRVAKAAAGRALSARLELRRTLAADEDALLALANDPALREASFDTHRISPHEHRAWFTARLADPDTLILLAWDGPNLAGYVRFEVTGDRAEVSVALAEEYRGSGYAPYLLGDALGKLRAEFPGIHDVFAEVRDENIASVRLFEMVGFQEVARSRSGRIALVKEL